MGVAFRRDLFLVTRQVYPELQDKEKLTHTKIQQKLLRKLGDNAFPFFFEVSQKQKPPSIIFHHFSKLTQQNSVQNHEPNPVQTPEQNPEYNLEQTPKQNPEQIPEQTPEPNPE